MVFAQRGVALLIMLSMLVLAITVALIAQLSLNQLHTAQDHNSAKALHSASSSLLGYGVSQTVTGLLPCPDTDPQPDGLENRSGNACTNQLGRFPYRTLGSDELVDASGTHLWYAVAPLYSNNGGLTPLNSSISANYQLDGVAAAAVLISPGGPLLGQQRLPITVAGYLEGENANGSIDIYAQVNDEQNNDLLFGLATHNYWTLMESKILADVASLLRDYKAACSEYPWAADFVTGADASINLLQAGSLPLDSALPVDWNTACASGIEPSTELRNHWRDQIYYEFCLSADGNCIDVQGDVSQLAEAIIIAPGSILAAQIRSTFSTGDFFEHENSDGSSPYKYLKPANHDGTFNDSLLIVAP